MTATNPPLLRFTMEDIVAAHAAWGANCGPVALAACTGLTPDEIRPHLGTFASKGHMNPTDMDRALANAGFLSYSTRQTIPGFGDFPTHGLCVVQWHGPWMEPGVSRLARYRYTHWIAAKVHEGAEWVFDVNSLWQPLEVWRETTAKEIMASTKRASGEWSMPTRWEVRVSRKGLT